MAREHLLLALTVPAALAGSAISGLLYAVYEAGMHSYRGGGGAPELPVVLVFGLFAAFTGFVIALPGLLLIGVPLTWPLRRRIAAHPLPAAIVYGAIGAVAGRLIAMWMDRGTAFPGRYDLAAALFGAVTAIAWVVALRKGRALLDEPQ